MLIIGLFFQVSDYAVTLTQKLPRVRFYFCFCFDIIGICNLYFEIQKKSPRTSHNSIFREIKLSLTYPCPCPPPPSIGIFMTGVFFSSQIEIFKNVQIYACYRK